MGLFTISTRTSRQQEIYEQMAAAARRIPRNADTILTWDKRPGRRGRVLTLAIPTSLTDLTRALFSNGHCHSLALALHELGYQIAAVLPTGTEPALRDMKTVHFYAIHPTRPGYGIDIEGSRPIAEILARYPGCYSTPVDAPVRAVARLVDAGIYLPPNLTAGRRALNWILTPTGAAAR